ncbi:MAG: hypothetical protein LBH01_01100 [Verrucomicrobiales bacterium]|jgi:hypothetical protein|nr:hypothetical protein [Verrucomicrobiales bacterium]
MKCWILKNQQPARVEVDELPENFNNGIHNCVALDRIVSPSGNWIGVSTVLLPFHPEFFNTDTPCFETIAVGVRELEDFDWRCGTRDEALKQHAEVVALVNEALGKKRLDLS